MTKLELATRHAEAGMADQLQLQADLRKEAHELSLLCFAGGGGAVTLALKAGTAAVLVGLALSGACLFLIGGLIAAFVLRRRQAPVPWNLPRNFLGFDGTDEELQAGELHNMGERIERMMTLLNQRARVLNRFRVSVALAPAAGLVSGLAAWGLGF